MRICTRRMHHRHLLLVPLRVQSTLSESAETKPSPEDLVGLAEGHIRCNILVSELLDTTLIGEGWIPTVRDCRARLVTSNAICVPSGARLMAALVGSHAIK